MPKRFRPYKSSRFTSPYRLPCEAARRQFNWVWYRFTRLSSKLLIHDTSSRIKSFIIVNWINSRRSCDYVSYCQNTVAKIPRSRLRGFNPIHYRFKMYYDCWRLQHWNVSFQSFDTLILFTSCKHFPSSKYHNDVIIILKYYTRSQRQSGIKKATGKMPLGRPKF